MQLVSIGTVRSNLDDRDAAPKQGDEGAPDAWLEFDPALADGLEGVEPGAEMLLLTWLHLSARDVLRARPRDVGEPRGVFSTRSPERPNPIGLHRVTVLEVDGNRLHVEALEALDGTPIIDLKPLLRTIDER